MGGECDGRRADIGGKEGNLFQNLGHTRDYLRRI